MDRDDNQRPVGKDGSVPAALLQPWRRIGGLLAALIGESGVCVLFGRALRTVAARHAWLGMHGERHAFETLLRAYEADLDAVDAGEAAAANGALLDTFTRQLAALIGDALTARLLADAKQDKDGREGPPDAQEHSND